jgi:hypothetical protein
MYCCRPRLPAKAAQTVGTQRPARRLRCDPSAGFQDVAGDGQLMGRRADVGAGVMQHQVLEMHEFAVDPQRGAGVGKMRSFDPALTDRRTGDPLVKPGQGRAGVRNRSQQA